VIPRFRLIIRKNPISEAANFHINMRPPTVVTGLKRMLPISAHLLEQRNRQPPAREFYGPLIQPAPGDDWGAFARKTYDSYHHGVGTCKMGPASDPMAVVDQRLRVHGMQNLWVGDAAIMPVVSRANTNLTSIMIGERLADFVQEVA
jgi:choline dehydrogenase-like flavoprotein